MEKRKRITFIHSIKSKIVAMVILTVIFATGMCLWTVVPLMKRNMLGTMESYMRDVAAIAGANLDRVVADNGGVLPDSAAVADCVSGIQIDGMPSSYAYVVSGDGSYVYHPEESKIGQSLAEADGTSIADWFGETEGAHTEIAGYEEDGVAKYAACYISETGEFVLIVSADESEVYSETNEIITRSTECGIITILICIVVTTLIAFKLLSPFDRTTEVVAKIADMDFREHEKQASISKRKDESGAIGRSIDHLRTELVDVTKNIAEQSEKLYAASQTLSDSAAESAAAADQVERAVSEIAQGVNSQAQETQTANDNIILMGNMIEEANEEVEKLNDNAKTMRDASSSAMVILEELSAVNQKTKEAMRDIDGQINVTNESAMKIKAATDIITDIAEETNLLSLNASIEAARAGEQGRGFAIVAGQIQKLAEQSNESARKIEEVINVLIEESQKSVETMEEVRGVIEKQNENVESTQDAFTNVNRGIDSSIEGIQAIAEKTAKLDEARAKVVDVVQNLTTIAQENASGTEETSSSAAEVGAVMNTIAENAQELNNIAREMEASVKRFIIE
jgi:methyl-accepting chemotaxis protein